MAICSHKAPNGEKSNLFQTLQSKYSEEVASQIWDAIRTQQFLNKHGDWMTNPSSINGRKVNIYSGTITSLNPNQVFVFGSNTQGRHGKGAALWAKQNAGAIYGQAEGLQGNSFAIITKDLTKTTHPSRTKEQIEEQIDKLYQTARSNPTKEFIVAYKAEGTNLNAYTSKEMASFFSSQEVPSNIIFEDKFAQLLKPNSISNIDENGEPTYEWVKSALSLTEPTIKPSKIVQFSDPDNKLPIRESEESVDNRIKAMYEQAVANPDDTYDVTYRNLGDKKTHNSGYTSRELANIFDRYPIPANVRFNPSFYTLIQNSARRIVDELGENLPVELMNRGDATLNEHMLKVLTARTAADGRTVGYFTPTEQQEVIDSIIHFTQAIMLSDPNAKANALIKAMYAMYQKARQIEMKGGDQKLMENLMFIYRQRVKFADNTIRQMEGLGLHTDEKTKARVLRAIDALKPLGEKEKKELEETKPEILADLYDESTGEFIEAAGRGLNDWGDISFELDPKDTASARMKMFIATLPDMDRGVYREAASEETADVVVDPTKDILQWAKTDPLGFQKIVRTANRRTVWMKDEATTEKLTTFLSQQFPLVAKENFLGMRKLVDYESTFQDILETLADTKQDLTAYMDTLSNSGKPNLQYMVQELKKADISVQKEFAKVMSKQYQQFTMILFNPVTDKTGEKNMTLKAINANRYNQKNTIIKNWQQLQKLSEMMIINQAGDRVMDIERIKAEWLPLLHQLREINDWNSGQIRYASKNIHRILNQSGVDMTEEMVDYLFENMDKVTKGQKFPGGIARQFGITQDGKPNGMFSAFIMKAAGIAAIEEGEEVSTEQSLNRAELHNPLYTERSSMQMLAAVAAKFTPVLHSTNHRSSEGKNIWDYGLNTKLSHKMRDFTTNFTQFKTTLDKIDFAKNNWLTEMIANNPAIIANMKLGYLDGMKPVWGKRGITRQSMSDREQMLMSLAMFQNQGYGFNKIPRVNYLSLTHSDKTTTPLFTGMPKVNTGKAEVMDSTVIGTMDSAMYKVFKAEYSRIINQKGIDFNNARYNKGKNLFYMIPDFNYDAMKDLVRQGVISEKEFKSIWVNGSRELTQQINNDKELLVINKVLTHFAYQMITDTLDQWSRNNITDPEKLTTLFDKKYLQKILYQNGIAPVVIKDQVMYRDNAGKILTTQQFYDTVTLAAAKDYTINHFLFDSALSQIFYGDPAQTYKGKAGTHDLDQVDATMKEYAKRLAKDIAPGQDLYWEADQKKYTTISMADVKTSEEYLRNFPNLRKSYASQNAEDHEGPVEGTDAQEMTTTQEHLDTLFAGGLIHSKIYNEMSEIIRKADSGYYEFTSPEHLAVIMQPQKPVYSGNREVINGAQLEDYIKSSSYPLYPPFTAGTEMENLRTLMEKNGIQRANFESAKKIGLPNKPVTIFDKNGKFVTPSEGDLKGATQVLDRSGFRIQQEIPYDEDKNGIKTVSQENKLITEGITDMMNTFMIGEKEMTGSEVRAYKEAIRAKMINHNVENFLSEFSVPHNALANANWGMTNKGKVYDLLAEEARKKGYTMNELQSLLIRDDNGQLEIPLIFNTAADKLETMLMSMVRKVAEVKMPGKSFIQAASVGYTFTKESAIDRSKVIWLSDYDGTPLKTLRKEDGIVKPAQVLLPFNFFSAEGDRLNLEDYMIIDEKTGRRIINEEKMPRELLQLIGARIPNQGHNSMLPIEVVGFIPTIMGDLIIVPSAITKQMGADFDVDKLYTYRRNYNHDPETGFLSLVDTNPDVIDMSKSQLQEAYFDVHWGVLTNKDMIEKVLRPLDKPDLEEENKKLAEPGGIRSYYHVMNQLKDFQSGKEAKMLVGSTSLSVTFNAVIQNKDLHLFRKEWRTNEETGERYQVDVRDYIEVLDEHRGSVLALGNLSGNGISNYTSKDGGVVDATTQRTKHDNLTTMQSGAVDNAKNRTLDNLNLTRNTYRAAAAFVQLQTADGKAVNLKYVTRLLTQPIIKEFDRRMKTGNDSLSEEFTSKLRDKVITDLRSEYSGQMTEHEDNEAAIAAVRFDPQSLLTVQSFPPTSDTYLMHQIAALNLFSRLDDVGKRLSELQGLANQDTNGAGPNILSSLQKSEKMDNIDQVPIANAITIFTDNGNRTEQGVVYDATVKVSNNVLTQILPYDMMTELFEKIRVAGVKENLTIDQQRAVIRAFRSYVYTSDESWWTNPVAERIRLMYGEESLAKRIIDAKRTWGKDNYFLQRLDGAIGNSKESPDYVEYQAVSTGRIDEEQNNRGWLSLLVSNDETERRLGEDLIRYAFLTGGIQDANSFVKYAPVSYIANTDFGRMLKERMADLNNEEGQGDEFSITNGGFMKQYFQHNPEMAATISKESLDLLLNSMGGNTTLDYPEVFRVPDQETDLYNELGMDRYRQKNPDDDSLTPFISYRSKAENKWILYTKQQVGASTYYIRIDTLGNQYTDEYNGKNDSAERSIFTENRALAIEIASDLDNGLYSIGDEVNHDRNGNLIPENVGITEGGTEAIVKALGSIKDNESLPQRLRTVADVLLQNQANEKLIEQVLPILQSVGLIRDPYNKPGENTVIGFTPQVVLNYNADTWQQVFGVSYPTGRIEINVNNHGDNTKLVETYLHEILHHRLQNIIYLYESKVEQFTRMNSARVNNPEYFQNEIDAAKKLEKFKDENPEVQKHINALELIRAEVLNDYNKHFGFDLEDMMERRMNDLPVSEEAYIIGYSLQNVHEFVSVVMTNPVAQEWYNNRESPRGNILQRIWNTLTKIFQSMLGINVKEGSLLQEAIYHSVSLLNVTSSNTNITEALVNGTELRTEIEQEAKEMRDIGENIYKRNVQIDPDETGFGLKFAAFNQQQQMNPQIEKIYIKLKEQLKEAGRDRTKAKTPEDKVKANIRYRELSDDMAKLKRKQDLNLLAEIGNKQMRWVDTILSQPDPTATQTYAAINAANIWSGLIDIMYGDQSQVTSIDPKFSSLQANAQLRRLQLVNDKARGVVIDAFGSRIPVKDTDFNTGIPEMKITESNLITLSRAKSVLAQGIAVLGRRAANNRDEEIYRVSKKLDWIKGEMKKHNLKQNAFMDEDENGKTTWNLVTRLTHKWFDITSSLRRELDKKLHDADMSQGINEIARREMKSRAWEKYWKDISKHAAFVDTRVFFDLTDGSIKTDAAAIRALAKLTQEVGSQQYASELVDQAQELYKEYLSERDIAHDHFENTIILEDSEKVGLTQAEQDTLLVQKKSDAYKNWLSYNSPNEFMSKISGTSSKNNAGDRFIIKAPKNIQGNDFYSQKYTDIQADPVKRPIYDKYREIISEMVSYLPATEQEKLDEDFLPFVSQDLVNNLAEMIGKVRNWDSTLLNTFTATEAEEFARIRPNEIPIMYLHPTKRMEDEGNQSKDILRVAEVFSMMALHYKYMAPVLDQINVAESIIKEVNRQRVGKETSGKPLENLQKSVAYFKDALIFKKPRELEGKVKKEIYSGNPARQIKAQNEIKELMKRKNEIEKEIEDQMNLGVFQTPLLDLELEDINAKLDEYAANARYIYASKGTDFLISVNQLKALSYNPFSAISNFTFGMVSMFIHASGRVDYDQATARRAMGIMSNSVAKYYTFGTYQNPEARKVLALMDRLGIIGEVVDSQIGGTNMRDRSKGWKSALAPFNWQKSGDFYAKGTVMVAMLLKKQVEVEENGEKKTISLWDAMSEEGQWNEARFGVRPEWYSDEAAEQTELNNYRERIRKVGTIVFGNQDKNAPLLARKSMWMRLLGQFRMSWLPEGVATRFMDERFDAELGRSVKGRFKTYTDLGLFTSAGLIVKQLLAQLPGIKSDPFAGVVNDNGDPISELDIENMRKNFAGLAWTIAFLTSILLMRGIYDGDKKRGKKKTLSAMQRQLLINMLIRNHQDLMMYAGPGTFEAVSGNLVPAYAVVNDAWKAIKATNHYMFGDIKKEKDPFDKWIMKVSRAFPVTNLYPKTKYMLKRDLDAISK